MYLIVMATMKKVFVLFVLKYDFRHMNAKTSVKNAQSGSLILDHFFEDLGPYIGNTVRNVIFEVGNFLGFPHIIMKKYKIMRYLNISFNKLTIGDYLTGCTLI